MNTSFLCTLALLAADPSGHLQHVQYDPLGSFSASVQEVDLPPLIVRAQDSPFYGGGGSPPPTYAPPGGATAPIPATPPGLGDPFAGTVQPPYGVPITGDPFLGGAAAPAPAGFNPYGPQPALYTFGLNGAQPFQYGWQARYDVGFLPSEGTSNPNVGSLSIFEADIEKELAMPVWSGHTFSIAPQFGYRAWDGPFAAPVGNSGLPADAFRFGLGLKLATPVYGAWQFEVGFNPAIASDFNSGISSDAVLFDGHVAAFWRTSPEWLIVLGAAYWDRVDHIILPYAGAVWTPNEYWEFRLVFPKPRISWFTGTPFGIPTWLYAAGEYHVDAFEVNVDPINRDSLVQFKDWRVVGGVRSEFGSVTTFLEAGWVLGREVEFDAPFGTDFDINDGLIVRGGFRY